MPDKKIILATGKSLEERIEDLEVTVNTLKAKVTELENK
jgi:hypothetical protein